MHLPQYLGFIFAYVFALMIMYLYFQLYLHLHFQLLHCPPNLKSCLWVGKTWRPESRDRLPVDHQVFHIFLCWCFRCCVYCFYSLFFPFLLLLYVHPFWVFDWAAPGRTTQWVLQSSVKPQQSTSTHQVFPWNPFSPSLSSWYRSSYFTSIVHALCLVCFKFFIFSFWFPLSVAGVDFPFVPKGEQPQPEEVEKTPRISISNIVWILSSSSDTFCQHNQIYFK